MGAEARGAHELLALLQGLEQRSRRYARGLPELTRNARQWDGLAFSVAGVRLVSLLSEVIEMFHLPAQVTRIPGVRGWMLGLANVRGSLLPLVDLQAYLGGESLVPDKASRVLVIRSRGVTSGLLVPRVLGMRHFDLSLCRDNARIEGPVGAYVFEAFVDGDEVWPVFNMSALAADPAFRVAAA